MSTIPQSEDIVVTSSSDMAAKNLKEIATEIYSIDLTQEEMVKSAAETWGDRPLDLLVNSAGLGPKPFDWDDHSADDLMDKFRVNVVGPFLAIKHFYPALQRSRQANIINISSNMASMSSLIENRRGRSLGYRLSKTALNQLTVSLGREFRSHDSKVTVNTIHPGWLPTAISSFTGPDDMDVQTGLMVETIERFRPDETGLYVNAKGEDMPW
ncbi:NAD(P)-binding protein [Coniochaeta sp. PMI_546]|nr:NAD(P)-binding protein [Coniochaeta sp. PMI_546]